MTKDAEKKTANMIYSPNYHIPLGQAVKMPDGNYGLRVKKDKNTFEIITLDQLMSQIVHVADAIL